MKRTRWLILSVLVIHLAIATYANRALYFSKFDKAYWQDRYAHSQWSLPVSDRTIGDDGLYLYEGYRLIHRADPTLINAEVPPLGKYLIGLSIALFGNGHIYGLVVSFASLCLLYLLANRLVGNKYLALITTALVATDPLITSQFPLTMLDMLQLFFILVFFLLLTQKTSILTSLLLGLTLGLFSEVKFPIMAPVLMLVTIFTQRGSLKNYAVLFFSFAFGYLLPYGWYLASGHSILDWFKVQKWIFAFYANGYTGRNVGNIMTSLLVGQYHNLFTNTRDAVSEFSLLWPIIFTIGMFSIFKLLNAKKPNNLSWFPLAVFCGLSLLFFSLVPFWTRYLVVILPFFYLFTVKLMSDHLKANRLLMTVLFFIIINEIASLKLLFPTPQPMLAQFAYSWERGFFQNMYVDLSQSSQKNITRDEFHRFGQKVYYDGEIEGATVTVTRNNLSRFRSPQVMPIAVKYMTRHLGSFNQETNLILVNEKGRWHVDWNWDNLIYNLTANTHLETKVDQAKRGSIISHGSILVKDFPSYLIWLIPEKITTKDQEPLFRLLQSLFGRSFTPVSMHHRLYGNTQPDWPIPLGVLPVTINAQTFNMLSRAPGVVLTPHLGRSDAVMINDTEAGGVANSLYRQCCSVLYTTTSYDGTSGAEKEYNSVLKGLNGGSLFLKDDTGKTLQTLINAEKKDGHDIILNNF